MLAVVALLVALMSMRFFWSRDFWFSVMDYGESCVDWVLANSMLCSAVALGAIPIIIAFCVVSRRPMMVHLNLDKE
jgi:hypothetical protein